MNPSSALRLVSWVLVGSALSLAVHTASHPVVLTSAAGSASNPVKPIKPPSPAFFNVTVDPHKVAAGSTAEVVVTLRLNSQPVSGAAVKLDMLFTPGNDYAFAPDSGATDANGTFSARVRVSKNPGDSIIAATSGVFSDQDHVAGTGAANQASAPTPTGPARGGAFAPLILMGVAAMTLVAAGLYLKVRSVGA
jgi:hypothetical protein